MAAVLPRHNASTAPVRLSRSGVACYPAAMQADEERDWLGVLARSPEALARMPPYAPIAEGPVVLGRLAQTLDGRIATRTGDSFWIGGAEDILHTHRLRALFDAVVVGAGTVRADDPLLTTRRCAGPSPVRVVIDAERRLDAGARVFQGPPRTLLVCDEAHAQVPAPGTAEVVGVRRGADGLDLAAILDALRARGLARIFIEGGGVTVSRFLAAGLLDRLHVTVAPLLLGDGVPGFRFAGVSRPSEGIRLHWTLHRLGGDVLFDIDLRRAQ
jgi:diaminohydroxyphosphoribosylaminopyrimidine deaminase / 5-amino-6-(5-phosphoribosylamino)uracil reductase